MTLQNHKYNFSIKREKRKLACFSEREKNRPKVNGKEFDGMHGLNTYDYSARQYNPVTGRWDRMDPLSEKYYSISPYAYCMNNPVRFVDPNGMWSWPWERKSLISYSGNGTFRLNMSKNKDVEKIGNNILSTLGRYDKEKNQYTYYISQ